MKVWLAAALFLAFVAGVVLLLKREKTPLCTAALLVLALAAVVLAGYLILTVVFLGGIP